MFLFLCLHFSRNINWSCVTVEKGLFAKIDEDAKSFILTCLKIKVSRMSGDKKVYSMVSKVQLDKPYKLLELTPELLKIIEEQKEKIYLKAPTDESDVVLCTNDKTYKIRQRNHSNTVLVMKENPIFEEGADDQLIGYTKLPSVFECQITTPSININDIPIYNGIEEITETKDNITIEKLKQRSAISEGEFDKVWFNINGTCFNDIAVILDEEFVSKALHLLIMSITAAELNFEELSIIEVYNSIKEEAPNFTISIVETILRKFSINEEEPLIFDKEKISKFYGIQSLKLNCLKKSLNSSEFLIKWKSELPPFFECPIDLSLLMGYYVTPLPEKIQYISRKTLSIDINNRLKQLFKLQSTWDLNELIPFIEEFNIKNLKWENFIMKFAKRKKIGKRIIITQK